MVTPSLNTLARKELERSQKNATGQVDIGAVQRNDEKLYELRELELTEEGWPTQLPNLKRIGLISADKISTTWECWSISLSQRVLAKVLRPIFSKDPVWRRRFSSGASWLSTSAKLNQAVPHLDGKWPHVIFPIEGTLLSDCYSDSDSDNSIVESRLLAQCLLAGLEGLGELHSKGLIHGAITRDCIVLERQRARLIWLDSFAISGGPSSDISDLAQSLTTLDPQGVEPLGALVGTWINEPPPNVEIAKALLVRTLAAHLTSRRHQLILRSRIMKCRGGEARLLRAVKSLSKALSPPTGKFCLKADEDGIMVVAISDGERVTGGGVASMPANFIPTVFSPENGIDPSASRVLLRSWATRRSGNQPLQAKVMADLGGDNKGAEQLCLWLSAQARLRAARKLLEL